MHFFFVTPPPPKSAFLRLIMQLPILRNNLMNKVYHDFLGGLPRQGKIPYPGMVKSILNTLYSLPRLTALKSRFSSKVDFQKK